ncbi:mediator of RNA polymerase II transcription subunit 31 isoform X3 [Grammomys surdaster]|uniref:mediator of RNA polymerase II transcription subunit 31 isoform X3 n=1 Tax=Grammomys surdaster TaxID=491861 RepID=UPI00109F1823|nr:mediator of RNA polymerase II transcription subunit 31 isoform X3 [Grammomys surdaster]
MATAVAMETDDAGNRLRFQLELEFVQCLANPNYLNFLAQRGYFKDKAFVNYLKYLLYWKEPEYAKYLNACKTVSSLTWIIIGIAFISATTLTSLPSNKTKPVSTWEPAYAVSLI